MPYDILPPNPALDPSDELPLHLAHKPFYAMPYEAFDGCYAGKGQTDVRYVSVGIAQYDPYEVSIKTMRIVDGRWTRQAEELPLHRVVDMSLFLAKVVFDSQQGAVNMPAGTLTDQTSDVSVTPEQHTPGEVKTYDAAIKSHLPLLQERYGKLYDYLKTLKDQGRF